MGAAALRAIFLWLAHRRWMARLAMGTPLVRRVAFRFVAGTTLDQAAVAARALNESGISATLDVLGESVTERSTAERAAAAYVASLDRIAADGLDANVSVKLTQMGLDLSTDTCTDVLRPVLEVARRHGIFVRIDMESSAHTDRTLEVVRQLRAEGFDIGPVIQSYLHRSAADLAPFAGGRVRVRICKGAYDEPESIAWHHRAQINRSFVELCTTLLEADAYPGIGTHDPEMIDAVRRVAEERGVPKDRFEFQLLYGIRRDLQRQLVADGYRVRVYVPYGTEWYPYFMRRLAERPANVRFLLRSVFGERS